MTERSVVAVEEEVVETTKEPPTIDRVGVISVRHNVEENDDFAKSAENFKAYEGVTSVFKRRVTNELKKVRRGASGAESKQVNEKTFLRGYDAFDVIEPSHNLHSFAKLYELSSPHYSAVNAKVANIVGLGYKFVENSKTKRSFEGIEDEDKLKKKRRQLEIQREELHEILEELNEEDTFTEVLVKVWRDYETMGNGYIEIARNIDGSIGYFGHIPAQTLRIRRARDGFVQVSGFEVQFFANFGDGIDEEGNPIAVPNPVGADNSPNEVIHIKKYSPTSGYYGIPDIVAAQHAVAGNELASRYNLDYFENKAVPRYLIVLKGAQLGPSAEQSLLSFFETSLKGQSHRSVLVPLPADTPENPVSIEFTPIETGIQDSSFDNYRKANLSDILMAHRVPITKISVSEGASLAVARDADKTFKEQVCAPEQDMMEKKLKRVIKEFTEAFELSLNEMTLTDENTQSMIDERRRKTGTETANEQRAARGQAPVEGGDEIFDMNAQSKIAEMNNQTTRRGQDKSAAARSAQTATGTAGANANGNPSGTRQRDTERSAGRTDTAGEARNPQGEGRTTS